MFRIIKFIITLVFICTSEFVYADSVSISNDTLYCCLSEEEIGTLKSKASIVSDLNSIKTLVLSGYISQADEDFIHTLGKSYSLKNLDMTQLCSTMSYQGLEGCIKIETVKYSKYWDSTGEYLFQSCINLSEVTFPDEAECSLTTFSAGTFRGCTSLKSITIPKSIIRMGSQVFYGCTNLSEIRCLSGKAPMAIKETYGDQFRTANIIVPTGAVLNYKTSSGWCLFKNYFEDPNMIYHAEPLIETCNIVINNDTLYSDLTYDEQGYLRSFVINAVDDLTKIKYAVLSGYLNEDDGSFLNALSSAYNLSLLDMTNLRSPFADYQFQGCSQLTEIWYSRFWNTTGRYIFYNCSNISKVIFPNNHLGSGIVEFAPGTFRGCSSLSEIDIPSTVTSIGSQCFYGCRNLGIFRLHSATPPSANETSFDNQFATAKLIVPCGTKIYYETASGWSLFSVIEESTENVDISDEDISENVAISDSTLYVNLEKEEVGKLKTTVLMKYGNLNKIKYVVLSGYLNGEDTNFLNALASSYNLSVIDFTELKSSCDGHAFQGCIKLKKVIYSRYWNSTGFYLFQDCSSLEDVVFPENSIDKGITLFDTGSFRGCTSLQNVTVPASVTDIKSQCFYLCSKLKNIAFLGTSIQSIDKNAFADCYSLETLAFPNSLSLIGERCFEGCI